MENWFIPNATADLPEASRVLILSPHPDDEIFGCGGCAALYARAGTQVLNYVLTDGGGYFVGDERESIAEIRRAECLLAAKQIGVASSEFGPWEDRQLSAATDLVERLQALIQSSDVQVVFAPSLWEVHPDHRATAWAAIRAIQNLAKAGGQVPVLALYEIGAPLRPTHLVDISAVQAIKKNAMACFGSQLKHQRYDLHVSALNTFRTYTLPPSVAAAEALEVVPPDQLQAFAHRYGEQYAPKLAVVTETALQHAVISFEELQSASRKTKQELEKQIASLLATKQELEKQIAPLLASLDQRHAELTQVRESLQQVTASRSWRLTRPVRWLSGQLRRFLI